MLAGVERGMALLLTPSEAERARERHLQRFLG